MTRPNLGRLLAAAAAFAIAAPAAAQMNMPGMTMPMPTTKPAAKKPTAKKPATKKPAATKAGVKKAGAKAASARKAMPNKRPSPAKADPMAGHNIGAMPGMDMPAGHDMSTMPGMDMPAGHDMGAMDNAAPEGTSLPAGNAPPPPVPTDRAADAVYGAEAMHMGVHHLNMFHGGQKLAQVMFNLAEAQFRNGRDGFEWNGEVWYGGDINRLWVKSEGDGNFGQSIERAEVQALYSHAIGPYFNLQGGLRYDFKPNPSRVYATIGVEGLAQRFFELEGALFLSNKGELLARAEGYYDQRITQRLTLQPRAELNFAVQSTRATGTGAGLSDAEIGLRLRYDIRREFAPYVGVQYRQTFGDTRRFLREAGRDPGGLSLLTGVRFWF
ncbi:copper resistance protein B [Sphingomonas sp.]|uniref:copper resistance protein B n=1 Tax=Sphingomonas sp. TaxID=28214 RepID=UPI00286D3F03|nr:copper resistance protein B [Sphingomonas sp.]